MRRVLPYILVAGAGLLGPSIIGLLYSSQGQRILARRLIMLEQTEQEDWRAVSEKYVLRKVVRPVRLEIEPNVSLLLDPRDGLSAVILVTREWQPRVWAAISSALTEGAVFLDVGAHIGYDSLKASRRVGSTGRVVSFEPNPRTLGLLRDNIAASRAENVVVQPIACTARELTLTLYDATFERNSGASSLSAKNADELGNGNLRQFTVPGRPIDTVVAKMGLRRVDVIKMDIEGAEYEALQGARETLERYHPKLILEITPKKLAQFGATPEGVSAFLKSVGYDSCRQVDDDDWEWTRSGAPVR